jgi:hypothetical protein
MVMKKVALYSFFIILFTGGCAKTEFIEPDPPPFVGEWRLLFEQAYTYFTSTNDTTFIVSSTYMNRYINYQSDLFYRIYQGGDTTLGIYERNGNTVSMRSLFSFDTIPANYTIQTLTEDDLILEAEDRFLSFTDSLTIDTLVTFRKLVGTR